MRGSKLTCHKTTPLPLHANHAYPSLQHVPLHVPPHPSPPHPLFKPPSNSHQNLPKLIFIKTISLPPFFHYTSKVSFIVIINGWHSLSTSATPAAAATPSVSPDSEGGNGGDSGRVPPGPLRPHPRRNGYCAHCSHSTAGDFQPGSCPRGSCVVPHLFRILGLRWIRRGGGHRAIMDLQVYIYAINY